MAKMKTFAVEVEFTVTRTVFVEARRPGGAEAKVLTREGWAEATRYCDDDVLDFYIVPPPGMTVTRIREA
jgi:hypothetical protein